MKCSNCKKNITKVAYVNGKAYCQDCWYKKKGSKRRIPMGKIWERWIKLSTR